MPAYWIARAKINDPVEYKKYTDLVPAIIAKYGGKVLARGGELLDTLFQPRAFLQRVVEKTLALGGGQVGKVTQDFEYAANRRQRSDELTLQR